MEGRLPHGYTNRTRHVADGRVEKRYDGPARWDNARRELACLEALSSRLPVPTVVDRDPSVPMIVTEPVGGLHGQDLIDEGHGRQVLRLVGEALRSLQALDPALVAELSGAGPVIVHGDFGPQNMHLDLAAGSVVGIFDWESARVGRSVEDLAWAEWIVRMHHPHAVRDLEELFDAFGAEPPWPERQQAMISQCRRILAYCESSGMERSAADWRGLLARTESWPGL